jgi:hypothetical protein
MKRDTTKKGGPYFKKDGRGSVDSELEEHAAGTYSEVD